MSRTISTPDDNILVEMRQIDVSPGSPAPLRAGQHIGAMDASLFIGVEAGMRVTFLSSRVDWSPVAVEVVINGAPSGVLCAERDKDDPSVFAVWYNDLPTWAGERLTEPALQYARDVAAGLGGRLAKRVEKVVVDYVEV